MSRDRDGGLRDKDDHALLNQTPMHDRDYLLPQLWTT